MRYHASLMLMCALALGVLPGAATAQVRFDGKTWYVSEDPNSLRINSEGHLEWFAPHPPQQLIVRLPEMPLREVGDFAEVRYLYKAEGAGPGACQAKGGTRPDDLTGMSGTGDLRIGLFDSNGRGFVERDGHDYRNDIWRGYLGYHVRVFPHIPQDINRLIEDGETHLPGKMMKRDKPDNPSLLQAAASYRNWGPDISGFEAPLDRFVPLVLRLTRTDPNTVNFSVTIDNVNYHRFDKVISNQPQKIDVLAVYFPNPRPYTKITLAPISAAAPALQPALLKHVIVYREPSRFAGWPANCGAWNWGNQIVVGFIRGWYKPSSSSHSIDGGKSTKRVQARSIDGGETWTVEDAFNETGGRQKSFDGCVCERNSASGGLNNSV